MKILVSLFVYNERPYLPAFIEYYKSQGCDIVVVDNMSDDHSYEYLRRMKIPTTRLDTKGAFQLRHLQDALTRQIAVHRPHWVVYTGADLYYSFDKSIRETIETADKEGYNQISVQCISAMNTGEKINGPLQNSFFYGILQRNLIMISKFTSGFFIEADSIRIKDPKVKTVPGIVINYGACKPIREQKVKLMRRQKAWAMGMHKGWGTHYLAHQKRQWKWTKEELTYFPNTEAWKYIKKLQTTTPVK